MTTLIHDRHRGCRISTPAPEYRIISGRRYRLVSSGPDKDGAKDEADYRRAGGDRARVIKVADQWCVYVR